jgi:PKHD-type hydroxylase
MYKERLPQSRNGRRYLNQKNIFTRSSMETSTVKFNQGNDYEKKIKAFFNNYPEAGVIRIIPTFLSLKECQDLIAFAEEDKLQVGNIKTSNEIDHKIRKNKVLFLRRKKQPDLDWLFERVNDAVEAFSHNHSLDPLEGLQSNCLQLGKYDQADFYAWHQDSSLSIKRRVTFSIQLSSADTYQGGFLELFTKKGTIQVDKTIGTLSIFTSSTYHRVSPITSGVRYSLVGWYM